MSFVIDAILIFTAGFCIWAGARKGFVRSVMGVATTLVSAVAAYAFTPLLAVLIRGRFLGDSITDGIAERLNSLARDPATGVVNLDKIATDLDSSLTDFLNRFSGDMSEFIGRMRGVTDASEETVHGLAQDIGSGTVNVLSSVIAFLILFIASFILLSILTAVLDLVFSMPVLKGPNIALGLVFGVVEALFFVWILSIALAVLVRGLGAVEPKVFGDEVVNHTVVCSFFLKVNPLQLLYGLFR